MDNFEIDALLRNNKYTKKVFGDVLASDQLDQVQPTSKTLFYIINTETMQSNIPGHWYCLGISDKEIECFDSTSTMALKNKFLRNYIRKHGLKFKYNKCKIQNNKTAVCGLYCCCYIFFRARGYSFSYFLNKFRNSNNFLYNDMQIVKLFIKIF